MLEELAAILSDYFEVGSNCYHYILERVKHAELAPEDFREYDEDDVAEIAEYLIANGVTVQRWIPVTERLPEENKNVLVCLSSKVTVVAYLRENIWYVAWNRAVLNNITHWMPLPSTEVSK